MFASRFTFKKFAFSFGAGIVAGAIFGLLYAPVTGKKLQKKVLDVTDELQEKVRKMANA